MYSKIHNCVSDNVINIECYVEYICYQVFQSTEKPGFFFLQSPGWEEPDQCPDKSNIVNEIVTTNGSIQSCPSNYTYHDWRGDEKTIENIDWTYFFCHRNKKCIHQEARCDLHPNPSCIYYDNESEQFRAEDEENCLDEYKRKKIVEKSANFKCHHSIHNESSPAVLATVFNYTLRRNIYNKTIIPNGTVVHAYGTRCDGTIQCFDGSDEDGCSLSATKTIAIGKSNRHQ